MAISSIKYNLANSYGAYNQKLTQETRDKLIELGIQFSASTTEAEGKRLIAAAEAKNTAKEDSNMFSKKENTSDLFEKAKTLAQKLGIEVNEGTNFSALLTKIEAKLEQLINVNKNNINALNELKGLSQELANLQAESNGSSGYDNTNQALMKSLEIMAQYNMNYLNSDNQKK